MIAGILSGFCQPFSSTLNLYNSIVFVTIQHNNLMGGNFDEFSEMLAIRQNFPHQSLRD